MPDQKSPRSFGDDRQVLTLLLEYQRDSLARKVFGVSEVAARQSRVPSGATLLWLIEHLAYAERLWIMHRFVGGEKPVPITTHRTVDSALAAYRGSWTTFPQDQQSYQSGVHHQGREAPPRWRFDPTPTPLRRQGNW